MFIQNIYKIYQMNEKVKQVTVSKIVCCYILYLVAEGRIQQISNGHKRNKEYYMSLQNQCGRARHEVTLTRFDLLLYLCVHIDHERT